MRRFARALQRGVWRGFARADAAMNRLYGWRLNPLYQSGTLAVLCLAVLFATGLYLLLFYRIGEPYESVARIQDQAWAGRWIRSLHRYAADGAVAAAAVHAFRIFAQDRAWGPRALAWVSGLLLLAVVLVSGWTGYVMVWDVPGQVLAVEGARLLDALPLFSEPISRAFVGESPVPSAFFFLNLFLHIALPIGLGLLLWLHTSRIARAVLLPPRALAWGGLGFLLILSVLWPAPMPPKADLLRLPVRAPLDAFYAFWLPLSVRLPPGVVWLAGTAAGLLVLFVPFWASPSRNRRPPPSRVDERVCTGCRQCYLDCPYEAVAMVEQEGEGRLVARVDPALCVSCGICAASCAPMRVGPPGRTGREQLARARVFAAEAGLGPGTVVAVVCDRWGLWGEGPRGLPPGVALYPVPCGGSVHTSVVELLLRRGAAGVAVVSCPPRDCWNREGALWLRERLYRGREAELQDRVDRRRVRLLYAGDGEMPRAVRELGRFREEVLALEGGAEGVGEVLIRECDAPAPGVRP